MIKNLISYKGLFTQGRKRKRIRNINLEWFKTMEAFTLGQKRKRKRKFTFTAAVFYWVIQVYQKRCRVK